MALVAGILAVVIAGLTAFGAEAKGVQFARVAMASGQH